VLFRSLQSLLLSVFVAVLSIGTSVFWYPQLQAFHSHHSAPTASPQPPSPPSVSAEEHLQLQRMIVMEIDARRTESEACATAMNDANEKIGNIKSQIKTTQEALTQSLEDKIKALSGVEQLVHELTTIKTQLEESRIEGMLHQQARAEALKKREEIATEIKARDLSRNQTQTHLEECQRVMQAMGTRLNSAQNETQTTKNKLEKLSSELAEVLAANSELNTEVEVKDRELEQLKNIAQLVQEKLVDTETELRSLRAQTKKEEKDDAADLLSNKLRAKQDHVNSLEAELAKEKSSKDLLFKTVEQLTAERDVLLAKFLDSSI